TKEAKLPQGGHPVATQPSTPPRPTVPPSYGGTKGKLLQWRRLTNNIFSSPTLAARSSDRRGADRRGGYTLMEVLIALTILALVLTVLLGTQANSVQRGSRANDTTTAT